MTLRLPPRTVRTLQEMYASPADPAYWDQLQQRIVEQIAAEPAPQKKVLGVVRIARGPAWEKAFRPWTRMGLIAAGIAVVCAGAVTWQGQTTEAAVAYESVISSNTTSASSWLAEMTGTEATGNTDGRTP